MKFIEVQERSQDLRSTSRSTKNKRAENFHSLLFLFSEHKKDHNGCTVVTFFNLTLNTQNLTLPVPCLNSQLLTLNSYFLSLSLITNLTGVPSRPKISLIWFSR